MFNIQAERAVYEVAQELTLYTQGRVRFTPVTFRLPSAYCLLLMPLGRKGKKLPHPRLFVLRHLKDGVTLYFLEVQREVAEVLPAYGLRELLGGNWTSKAKEQVFIPPVLNVYEKVSEFIYQCLSRKSEPCSQKKKPSEFQLEHQEGQEENTS